MSTTYTEQQKYKIDLHQTRSPIPEGSRFLHLCHSEDVLAADSVEALFRG